MSCGGRGAKKCKIRIGEGASGRLECSGQVKGFVRQMFKVIPPPLCIIVASPEDPGGGSFDARPEV